MIVAEMIEWLKTQPPTNTVLVRLTAAASIYPDRTNLYTDITRTGDERSALRFSTASNSHE